MIPGERFFASEPIILWPVGSVTSVEVTNTDRRDIWVGSHFPLFEVNRELRFDRAAAWGRRLAIPAGDCLLFPAGQTVTVKLVEFGGLRRVVGFNALSGGETTSDLLEPALRRMRGAGFQDLAEPR